MFSESEQLRLGMQLMFVAWVVLVVLTAKRTLKEGSVGLPAALLFVMSFLYGGCFVYAIPGYTHLRPDGHWYLLNFNFSEWLVLKATFVSLVGVLGFAIGSGVFARRRKSLGVSPGKSRINLRASIVILGGIGLLAFAMHYLRIEFPMSGAVLEMGRNLAMAAICLGAWTSWRAGRSMLPWMLLLCLIVLYYLVLFGFVSYGFLMVNIMVGFYLAQLRQHQSRTGLREALMSALGIYLALTLFVGWFSFRGEMRKAVEAGSTSSEVWEVLSDGISRTEILVPWNFAALDIVNIRLNLPIFIGLMMEQHDSNPSMRMHGATLVIIPLAIVPRIFWPEKPERGGSEFMNEHTGLSLSETTTFGTGSVFEFYVNFGLVGVFFGFVLLGWIVRRIDRGAARALERGDFLDFSRYFVVGIVTIDPLLRPFFIANGALLAWIMMTVLKRALETPAGRQGGPILRQRKA